MQCYPQILLHLLESSRSRRFCVRLLEASQSLSQWAKKWSEYHVGKCTTVVVIKITAREVEDKLENERQRINASNKSFPRPTVVYHLRIKQWQVAVQHADCRGSRVILQHPWATADNHEILKYNSPRWSPSEYITLDN